MQSGGGLSVDELEDALDELAERQAHFMGRYLIGSNVERRSGGQGVVQFARIVNTPDEVAIKFYTHREVPSSPLPVPPLQAPHARDMCDANT